jgi:hypothetical protein
MTRPCLAQGFFAIAGEEVAFRYNLLNAALSQA